MEKPKRTKEEKINEWEWELVQAFRALPDNLKQKAGALKWKKKQPAEKTCKNGRQGRSHPKYWQGKS